jgi:hypothetical protein
MFFRPRLFQAGLARVDQRCCVFCETFRAKYKDEQAVHGTLGFFRKVARPESEYFLDEATKREKRQ